jgi:hypothetical protein
MIPTKKKAARVILVHELRAATAPRGRQAAVLREARLPRATFFRWQARVRRGEPAYRRPGPSPTRPLDADALQRDLGTLRHGPRRSRGVGALHAAYRGALSRRNLDHRVAEMRRAHHREARLALRRLAWLVSGSVWAMDPTFAGGWPLHRVMDLASRFQFHPLWMPRLYGTDVAAHLDDLFRRFGPPLVLKRDNGANLNTPEVNEILRAWRVLPLNSPCAYPRFNGSLERAQREVVLPAPVAARPSESRPERALTDALNHRPRPVLRGRCAAAVFADRIPGDRLFDRDRRTEIQGWIRTEQLAILRTMKGDATRNALCAYRRAVESVLVHLNLIRIQTHVLCYPIP